MTDFAPFERDIARALEDYLGPRRPVDAPAIRRAAIASAVPRPVGLRASLAGVRRLTWLGLVGLALLALLGFAINFGRDTSRPTLAPATAQFPTQEAVLPPPPSHELPLPTSSIPSVEPPTPVASAGTPAPNSTPTPAADYLDVLGTAPSSGPLPTLPAVDGPFELVVVGQSGVSVVGSDGERLVASIAKPPVATFCEDDNGAVSVDGWLRHMGSIGDQCVVWLYDLSHPESAPFAITTAGNDISAPVWGPNGLLALDNGNVVFDPRNQTTFVPVEPLATGEIGPSWTADGAGIIDPNGPGGAGVMPFVGTYEVGLQASSDRLIGRDGNALCSYWMIYVSQSTGCNPPDFGTLETGPVHDWTSGVPHSIDLPWAAGFATNGRSIWTTVRRNSNNRQIELDRLDGPSQIGKSIEIATDHPSIVGSFGISPDDAAFALGLVQIADGPHVSQRLYVPADGSPPVTLDAWPAGWVPKALADSWPTVAAP